MDFKECLFSRRSIRHFTEEPVSDSIIREIINAGIYAPSACNFEAWKFIVINNDTPNKNVLDNPIIKRAPYGILAVYRNDLYVSGRPFYDYIQSASAAIENMLLYINSIGLGAVWICNLPKASVIKKAFNIPRNFDVIGYFAFGHPKKSYENSAQEMIYHYGDETAFKEHKRKFTIDQVLCNDCFYTIDGDCTFAKYPTKQFWRKNKYKNIIKRIIRK